MFPTGAYNQIPMGYQYPGQQPPPPAPAAIYQSQYAGFNPAPFQQAPPPSRGQSLPATGRHYPPPSGPYASISSRRNGQYPQPVPPQNYEHHTHGSKKHHKQRSVSPNGAADQSLYSDKEKDDRSRSHSPALGSQTKEGEANQNQEQNSQSAENASGEILQDGTNATEEQQNSQEKEKRKSRSKKKKHHRYEQYHHQYQPQPPFYGELPPQMRVHHQPLYSGYNQAFEESIRRGDVYHKQAKRSARLPPEVKKQLLPHEDDHQKQYPFAGYPPQQPFRPPFNPYQPGFYPQPTPYNTPQPWSNIGGINPNPAEQEIQRLRSHIHTLEGELHKLQKKLNKASIHQEENNRSPRQTPVIVELNNAETANRESTSKKKHRHRNGSSQNTAPPSEENPTDQSTSNQQQTDLRERSRSGGNQISDADAKPPSKSSREETAAQLAHAAAAHVNARQQVPAPPPVQQQYPYQQAGFVPPQPPLQQIRGPVPRPPFPGNVYLPNDPYQQRNFNQSNNTEIMDKQEERRNRRSADKILDAFERFYMTKSTTAPMKVKYIPEENNSNHQRNTNNNNNCRDRSRSQNSSTSN